MKNFLTAGIHHHKKSTEVFKDRLLSTLIVAMLCACAAGHFVYMAVGSMPSILVNLASMVVLLVTFFINRQGYNTLAWHFGLSSPAILLSVYTIAGHAIQTTAFIVFSFFIISIYVFRDKKSFWYYTVLFGTCSTVILLSPYINHSAIPNSNFLHFYKGFLGLSLIMGFMLLYNKELKANDNKIKLLVKELDRQNDQLEEKISERTRKLEKSVENLRRSNKDLEQFAYMASHDLQEPLRMVGNYIQLVDRRYNTVLDQEGRTYIQYAVDGTRRMSNLIRELLEFARLDNGEPQDSRTAEPLTVIREKINDLNNLIEEKNAEIFLGNLPEQVACDPYHLGMLFHNLISNGIKYNTDPNPQISIAGEELEKYWLFSVSDNGIGIPKENQEMVFELFKRLHPADEYNGLGIGLATCRKIVDRYAGEIWVDSFGNLGSTFYFTLSKKKSRSWNYNPKR